jgi:hypothetical protein
MDLTNNGLESLWLPSSPGNHNWGKRSCVTSSTSSQSEVEVSDRSFKAVLSLCMESQTRLLNECYRGFKEYTRDAERYDTDVDVYERVMMGWE